MYPRGRGGWSARGRGGRRPNSVEDVRNKLIASRRNVTDARSVIRQHVVEKVGDLRAMLKPKRGLFTRGRGQRGRPAGSRPMGNGAPYNPKPKLVYAEDLNTKISNRGKPQSQADGVTVTISRRRGRSIEASETVQPTGIPAHMRRQPSPPPPRVVGNKPAHKPVGPQGYNRQQVHGAVYAGGGNQYPPLRHTRRSFSPPPPAFGRPQSYITSPVKRSAPSVVPADYDDWVPRKTGRYAEHRSRSRSPLHPHDRRSPYLYYDNGRSGFRAASPEPYRRPSDDWDKPHSPVPYGYGASPSPRGFQDDDRNNPFAARPSGLRMDRVPINSGHSYKREMDTYARDPQPNRTIVNKPTPPRPMSYTVKVTSLSHDVSEEDVVELFSDIGELVSAKLISKGHAEVTFVHKKDAKTAIEKYDRRELDGIPMNLKLIEKPLPAASSSSKGRKLLTPAQPDRGRSVSARSAKGVSRREGRRNVHK